MSPGRRLAEPTPQPRVPREAVSWCISDYAWSAWEYRGEIVEKAHRIEVLPPDARGREYHKPVCGAIRFNHDGEHCVEAPEGFPACRNCARLKVKEGAIPQAFLDI